MMTIFHGQNACNLYTYCKCGLDNIAIVCLFIFILHTKMHRGTTNLILWCDSYCSPVVQSVLYDVRIFLCMDGHYILSDSVMAVLFRQVPVAVFLSICLHVYSLSVIQPKHVLKHVFKNLVIGSTMCYLMGMSSHALNDSIYIEIWMSNMQILLGGRFLAMVKINHIFRSYGDKTGKFKCFK